MFYDRSVSSSLRIIFPEKLISSEGSRKLPTNTQHQMVAANLFASRQASETKWRNDRQR